MASFDWLTHVLNCENSDPKHLRRCMVTRGFTVVLWAFFFLVVFQLLIYRLQYKARLLRPGRTEGLTMRFRILVLTLAFAGYNVIHYQVIEPQNRGRYFLLVEILEVNLMACIITFYLRMA
jgi:hypothetical protein